MLSRELEGCAGSGEGERKNENISDGRSGLHSW